MTLTNKMARPVVRATAEPMSQTYPGEEKNMNKVIGSTNAAKGATADYEALLRDLEGDICDIISMASIVHELWEGHRHDADKRRPSGDHYFSIMMMPYEVNRFDFAVIDVENRLDTLKKRWYAAIDGREFKS